MVLIGAYGGFRFKSAMIAWLLLGIIGTSSNEAMMAQKQDMQKIDSTVLGELNSIDMEMGKIYQAMLVLLSQSVRMKSNRMDEIKYENDQKLRSAIEACEAKKREIGNEIQAAWDAFAAAMAACAAGMADVAITCDIGQDVNGSFDAQKAQRFRGTASTLKVKLALLNVKVSQLRDMLNSGKIEFVPIDDIEKLKNRFGKSLMQLRDTKRSVMERVKK